MPVRYWKLIGKDPDTVCRVYRWERSRHAGRGLERFEAGRWVDAHDRLLAVVEDPDYVEVDKAEADLLIRRLSLGDISD
jgi:hypothetical protein